MAKTRQTKGSKDVPEVAPPNPHGRWTRVALTIAPLLVLLFAREIVLPNVDVAMVEGMHVSSERYSIVALGITPLVSAALLVELAAVLVPRWRHLRHAGEIGRAKLQRATNIVFVFLAVFQAYASTTFFQSQLLMARIGILPEIMMTITLVAGAMLVKLAADFISARGVVNGYGAIVVAWCTAEIGHDLWLRTDVFTPLAIAVLFAKIGAIAALTFYVLEKLGQDGSRAMTQTSGAEETGEESLEAENPYASPGENKNSSEVKQKLGRNPVQIPNPASGIVPYSMVFSMLAIPAAVYWIPGMQALADALEHPVPRALVTISLFVSLTMLFAWLFQQPRRVADVYARADESKGHRGRHEVEAQSALRLATAYALLYMFGLLVIDLAAKKYVPSLTPIGTLVLVTAVIIDFASEWRMLAKRRDLVSVWPEHRPYALGIAKKVLHDAGIFVHVRNERQRRILQFAASYVPMEICVPHADARRAGEILQKVLRTKSVGTSEHAENEVRPVDSGVPRRPVGASLVAGIVFLGVIALGMALPTYRPPKTRDARTTKLEFVLVDDNAEIADKRTQAEAEGTHRIRFQQEQVSLGLGKQAVRPYAVAEKLDHETIGAARERLEAWIKTITLPAGVRVGLGEYQSFDEVSGKMIVIGWRTYLLKGSAIVTEADVDEAQAMPDPSYVGNWLVRLVFTSNGAQRFEQATAENIKRRFAILLDGIVKSAPVIQSKIPGGVATITMGNADVQQQRLDAMNLEKAINGD